jgi:hypothetical protein
VILIAGKKAHFISHWSSATGVQQCTCLHILEKGYLKHRGRLLKGKNFSKGHIFIKMIERIKAKLAEIPMHWDPPGAA